MSGFWNWWNGRADTTNDIATTTEEVATMADADFNHATQIQGDVQNDVQGNQEQPYGVRMGVTAKDVITGFTGFVVSRDLHLSGTVQFTLQPPCKEGDLDKLPLSYAFDGDRLIIVEGGMTSIPTQLDHYTIKLGQEVEDRVTGFKGTVVEIIEQFNGCVHIRALSKIVEGDNTSGQYTTLDHKRFKVLSHGVSQASSEPIKTSYTGCCISRDEHRTRF